MNKLLPFALLLALGGAHAEPAAPAPALTPVQATPVQAAPEAGGIATDKHHAALVQMLRALNLTSSLQVAFRQNLIDSGEPAEKPLAQCIIAHFDEAAVLALLLPGFENTLSDDEANRLARFFHSGVGQKIADALDNPQSAAPQLSPSETKAITADPPLASALTHLADSLREHNQQIGQQAREKALSLANSECRDYLPKPADTATAASAPATPTTP